MLDNIDLFKLKVNLLTYLIFGATAKASAAAVPAALPLSCRLWDADGGKEIL